jgi:hypothetical protein
MFILYISASCCQWLQAKKEKKEESFSAVARMGGGFIFKN